MGRTLAPIAVIYQYYVQSLKRFRRALRRSEQLALDELLIGVSYHLAPAAYAAHTIPEEIFILAMLLEEHKEILRLRARLAALQDNQPRATPMD